MEPAVQPFIKALRNTDVEDPVISVYSNIDGKVYRNAEHIRRQLPKQVRAFILKNQVPLVTSHI